MRQIADSGAQIDDKSQIQRMRPAGSEGQGLVHVLLMGNREEELWERAQSKYEEMQQLIKHGGAVRMCEDTDSPATENTRLLWVVEKLGINSWVVQGRV